jgi:hypothetical protein
MKRTRNRVIHLLVTLFFLACAASAAAGETGRWMGPEGEPLPFSSDEEVLEFLEKARVVEKKELPFGTNRPWKMLLEKDGIQANAIFRTVDIQRERAKIEGKIYVEFHDRALYECAAYRVARLLGIDRIPPCVRRNFDRVEGTLQLWIEDAITELERRESGKTLGDLGLETARVRQTLRLFDLLVANIDRNLGNLLIDAGGTMWFIDHTRTFGVSTEVEGLSRLVWCDQAVWEALKSLSKKQLYRELRGLVDGRRILALLERRDQLVAHIEQRIGELGEGAVLFDESTPTDTLSDLEIATAPDELPRNTSLPVF